MRVDEAERRALGMGQRLSVDHPDRTHLTQGQPVALFDAQSGAALAVGEVVCREGALMIQPRRVLTGAHNRDDE